MIIVLLTLRELNLNLVLIVIVLLLTLNCRRKCEVLRDTPCTSARKLSLSFKQDNSCPVDRFRTHKPHGRSTATMRNLLYLQFTSDDPKIEEPCAGMRHVYILPITLILHGTKMRLAILSGSAPCQQNVVRPAASAVARMNRCSPPWDHTTVWETDIIRKFLPENDNSFAIANHYDITNMTNSLCTKTVARSANQGSVHNPRFVKLEPFPGICYIYMAAVYSYRDPKRSHATGV